MPRVVDPANFTVPVAIDGDGRPRQIRDGRPAADWLGCPICGGRVAFVAETEARAAHFRHVRRAECDRLVQHHRETLHDGLRDCVAEMLNGDRRARDLMRGGPLDLPTGEAVVERVAPGGYRPDVTVLPAEGERAPRLELEVVHHHPPTPERVAAAAEAGAVVAVMDAAHGEAAYYASLHAGEAPDYRAIAETLRFRVLTDRAQSRIASGVATREYLPAAPGTGTCGVDSPSAARRTATDRGAPRVPPWLDLDLTPLERWRAVLHDSPHLKPMAERLKQIDDPQILLAIEEGRPPAKRRLREEEQRLVRCWRDVMEGPPY
jgi:hypothetical protein